MKLLTAYRCLCDETRLRMLNLLLDGPLCVCHFAVILEMDQPKVSRHLKVLKQAGFVTTERCYNWTICRLSDELGPLLEVNLKCIRDLRNEESFFGGDLERRDRTVKEITSGDCSDLPSKIRALCQVVC
ncbi:MAG: metalloregulator ArsR/SmtB family transcription factor [Opitutales bacterium]|nr:metalloregulator ArsR/SmtB family transcription factor [Opitutales bacterium]